MGADYYAKVVIGMKVKFPLYTTSREKAFAHRFPADYTHDPKSGKPLWREVQNPIEGYDPDKATLYGYDVVFGTDDVDAYLCVFHAKSGSSNCGVPMSREALMNTEGDETIQGEIRVFRSTLQNKGVWNDKLSGSGQFSIAPINR